jgi:serine/threonine protein kinase
LVVAAPVNTGEVTRDAIPVGPFEVVGELGTGGSGKVFAIRRDGQDLALKVLRSDLALSARERQRFLDEADRMRRVSHPGIVQLVDAGALDDGRPYISMPLLRGETLSSRLAKGRLDRLTALRYFVEIADAVAAIHEEGLIHRDIKPENVMLCDDGQTGTVHPVLLDLGIARDVDGASSTTTEQGGVRGTRAYMAPERFFGVAASVATDVYELAVLLYMMLVGQAPWGSDDGAASRLHPREPSELGVELPEALTTAMLRALSTRPEVRPSSIAAFARLVQDVSPPIPSVRPSARPSAAPRRRRWVAPLGIASGVGLVAIAATLAFRPSGHAAVDSRPVQEPTGSLVPTSVAPEPPAIAVVSATPPAAPVIVPSTADRRRPSSGATNPVVSRKPGGPSAAKTHEPIAPAVPTVTAVPAVPPATASPPADRLYMDRK